MTFKLTQTRTTAGPGAAWRAGAMPGVHPEPSPIDVHSFQAIYDAYYAEVARWIRALGGPAADQDDLIQEVFVVVYLRLHDFDGRNLAGWLYRITAHQVRDYRRLVWIKYIFRRSVALSSEVASARPTPVRSTGPAASPSPKACASSPARAAVRIIDDPSQPGAYRFDPSSVTVACGGTVSITNGTGATHTFSPRHGGFHDTGPIGPRVGASVRMYYRGTFGFQCHFHSYMTGTVRVT